MKLIVLDTDVLTLYQLGDPLVVRRAAALSPTELAVTIITIEEELTGWYTRLRRVRKRDQLAQVYQRLTDSIRFLARFQFLSFAERSIIRYEHLRALHRRIGKNDLRIAAIVLEERATLATRTIRYFRQISGLQIEDWSK